MAAGSHAWKHHQQDKKSAQSAATISADWDLTLNKPTASFPMA